MSNAACSSCTANNACLYARSSTLLKKSENSRRVARMVYLNEEFEPFPGGHEKLQKFLILLRSEEASPGQA